MEYVRLGNSGLKVSKVILGTMSFGNPSPAMGWTIPEAEALPVLKRAYDLGINTWDTADVYSNGDSERIIASAIKTYSIPRESLVILAKVFSGMPEITEGMSQAEMFQKMAVNDGDMVNQVGLSRKHILAAVDASVKRLCTYIDVLQIHRLDPDIPKEEIMRTLNDVVESGKVRYIGACTMPTYEFQALQNIASLKNYHQFISMQDYYSLLHRENEREQIPYCKSTGVGLIPYSPLARGLLTRPHNPSSEPTLRQKTDVFAEFLLGKTTEADIEIIGRVEELAEKEGVSMAVISMAWSIAKGVEPIVGLSSVERVEEAVKAVKLVLSKEDVEFLEEKYAAKPLLGP